MNANRAVLIVGGAIVAFILIALAIADMNSRSARIAELEKRLEGLRLQIDALERRIKGKKAPAPGKQSK